MIQGAIPDVTQDAILDAVNHVDAVEADAFAVTCLRKFSAADADAKSLLPVNVKQHCGCEAAPSCGCETAPACGCGASPCGCGGKVGLLDRLRGRRGNPCDDGCCAPYPNSGCSDCGCGPVMSDMAPSVQTPMTPVPDSNQGIVAPPADKPVAPAVDKPIEPVADPDAEGGIAPAVAPDDKGANNGISVDPDAFLIKG